MSEQSNANPSPATSAAKPELTPAQKAAVVARDAAVQAVREHVHEILAEGAGAPAPATAPPARAKPVTAEPPHGPVAPEATSGPAPTPAPVPEPPAAPPPESTPTPSAPDEATLKRAALRGFTPEEIGDFGDKLNTILDRMDVASARAALERQRASTPPAAPSGAAPQPPPPTAGTTAPSKPPVPKGNGRPGQFNFTPIELSEGEEWAPEFKTLVENVHGLHADYTGRVSRVEQALGALLQHLLAQSQMAQLGEFDGMIGELGQEYGDFFGTGHTLSLPNESEHRSRRLNAYALGTQLLNTWNQMGERRTPRDAWLLALRTTAAEKTAELARQRAEQQLRDATGKFMAEPTKRKTVEAKAPRDKAVEAVRSYMSKGGLK